MPRFPVDRIQLAYEVHGAGEPLLLINGLGAGAWLWYRQIPALARRALVIAIDNRGAGASDAPDEPYGIARMADDAAALLDHLGIARAHVFGCSMGGYIAQELTLRHPQRVRTLALGCTSFGGPHVVPMSPATVDQMESEAAGGFAEPLLRRGLGLRFSDDFPDADDYLRRRVAHRPPLHGWERQLESCLAFDAEARASAIACPTLVMAGGDDPIVPAENSRRLAERIRDAEYVVYPRARHLFFVEQAEDVNRRVLALVSGGGHGSGSVRTHAGAARRSEPRRRARSRAARSQVPARGLSGRRA